MERLEGEATGDHLQEAELRRDGAAVQEEEPSSQSEAADQKSGQSAASKSAGSQSEATESATSQSEQSCSQNRFV